MSPAWLTSLKRWLGFGPPPPSDPKGQIEVWIAELKEQVPQLDAALAKVRGEVRRREGLVHQLDLQLAQLEAELKENLTKGDRSHASSLALERKTLQQNRASRVRSATEAKQEYERLEQLRGRYLESLTVQLRELHALLQERNTELLQQRVEELASQAKAAGVASPAEQALREAEQEG